MSDLRRDQHKNCPADPRLNCWLPECEKIKWLNFRVVCYLAIDNWRRQWHPTPVLLPGKSHGRRSLVGCSPWGREESDTTEWLHFHFSLSCIGEGNGNPLQYSCLENPKDGGAWWTAIYGVAQSRTRLKQLSSSSKLVKLMFLHVPLSFWAIRNSVRL